MNSGRLGLSTALLLAGACLLSYANGLTGAFAYDDANTAGQKAYSVANVRLGLRGRRVFAEAWVKNAFDTRYIPIAFAFGNFAPSGFIGEMGRPRTIGVRAGVHF